MRPGWDKLEVLTVYKYLKCSPKTGPVVKVDWSGATKWSMYAQVDSQGDCFEQRRARAVCTEQAGGLSPQ
jgi:hypothetical protein